MKRLFATLAVTTALAACTPAAEDAAAPAAAPADAATAHAAIDIKDLAPRVLMARITAPSSESVEATARFYAAAFDMTEFNRLGGAENVVEIFLGTGATKDEARASPNARMAVLLASDGFVSPSSHVLMQVSDMQAALDKAAAAGGKILSGPTESANLPIVTGFVADPAGNRVELIQYK